MKSKSLLISISVLFIVTIFFVIFLLTDTNTGYSKLYISEVLPNNFSIITDSDNDYSDYIEIYNGYSFDINLKGYHLSDKEFNTSLWEFPDVVIKSGEYLLVYASSKDKVTDDIHTNFRLSSSGEIITLSDSNGTILSKISYNETSYNTSIGFNGRKYVYYYTPTPGAKNIGEFSSNPILFNKEMSTIRINEYIVSNTSVYDLDGNYSSMIELYNYGKEDIELSNYYISDKLTKSSKYHLPKYNLKSNEYVTIYLSNKNKFENDEIHANFKIKSGEVLVFTTSYGEEIDKVDIIDLPNNVSYGLNSDGKWCYYPSSTFGKINDTKCFTKVGDIANE